MQPSAAWPQRLHRLVSWAGQAPASSSARTVGEFPEDVEVAVVPGGLLGQVEQDPAQRDRLVPPAQLALGGSVQVEGCHLVTVPRADRPVVREQRRRVAW